MINESLQCRLMPRALSAGVESSLYESVLTWRYEVSFRRLGRKQALQWSKAHVFAYQD